MTSPNFSKRYLFLDSSDYLVLGILDADLNWVEYIEFPDKKSASQIHPLLNELTHKKNLKPLDFEGVFVCSGPGSYTGIRLSENFAQIFEWQNKKVYSFLHYEIPYLLGVNEGTWCTSAFKGETFVYTWNGNQTDSKLAASLLVQDVIDNAFAHGGNKSTRQLIKENSAKFFDLLIKRNLRLPPYYFRALESEFKAQGT